MRAVAWDKHEKSTAVPTVESPGIFKAPTPTAPPAPIKRTKTRLKATLWSISQPTSSIASLLIERMAMKASRVPIPKIKA